MDRQIYGPGQRRRGQVLVLFAGALVFIIIICALTIDMGRIVTSQAQLQNAVDAAALAGASQLVGFSDAENKANATAEAETFAEQNIVAGQPLTLDPSRDIEFGLYVQDGQHWYFQPVTDPNAFVDSIRVTGRRSADSPDGPISLFFAPIFGIHAKNVAVTAVATQPRRYVMFVMDRSGSMCFDTYDITYRHSPNSDGSMDKSPRGWYWMPYQIRRYVSGKWRWRTAWFYAKNDDTGQIVTEFLPDHIKARLEEGKYFRYLDRDDPNRVQSGWLYAPSNVTIYSRWGSQYLQWRTNSYYQIESSDYAMANTGVEPINSSQNAATAFVDLLDPERAHAGLVSYGYGADLDQHLTDQFETLKAKIASYDPRGATATADGLRIAVDELLDPSRTTNFGQKIIVLLTDGNANYYNGRYYGNPSSTVNFFGHTVHCYIHPTVASALEYQTRRARDNGIRVYTISFGSAADLALMPLIASESSGAFYYADEAGDLTDVFVDIFYNLPSILTW